MTRFGLLLPHFGDLATRSRVVDRCVQIEEWGFDSVWTRDNLTFRGHGFEPQGTRLMDPFTTLTAIAALTRKLTVGTATLVPIRHPLVTSQLLGGIETIAGPGRLIVGIGAGGQKASFDVLGLPWDDRVDLVKEHVEVLRASWQGEDVSFSGRWTQFEGVTIDPRPPADTPIWYGGSTPASVRRAVEYCDGWFPGRCDLRTLDVRMAALKEQAAQVGKQMSTGIIPLVSIASNREEALAAINLDGLMAEAQRQKFWLGPFETPDDLAGILIAGSPTECIEQIGEFVNRGVGELVFDFRMRPADYDQQLEILATEVLPAVQELSRTAAGGA
jgi:alkanesulfonate monooxygenase SsuD/methylene tetrahydromethanopterin reductase-like flavin-dependent oxidoreductase (luciferase family)